MTISPAPPVDVAQKHRTEEFLRCQKEFLESMTPLERDCLFKINMQEAVGEPIDTVAHRIVHDKMDQHNARWRKRNASRYGPRYWYIL